MRKERDPTIDVGPFSRDESYINAYEPILTILAAAVAMRTSASTCIRSKADAFEP